MAIEKMMQGLRAFGAATLGIGVVLVFVPAAWAQDATAPDKAKVEAGENIYNNNCAVCHGDGLVSTGQFPNLRRLTPGDRERFETTVRNGRNQMPPWKGVLSDEEIDEVCAYIRANANTK